MKAVVGAFNQKKALVGAFSVIVQLHRLSVYSSSLDLLAGCDEESVPVGGVLDDDQGVAGDGYECLQLGVVGAVLHHHRPGQRAPQRGVGGEPRTDRQLLLRGEQCCSSHNYTGGNCIF